MASVQSQPQQQQQPQQQSQQQQPQQQPPPQQQQQQQLTPLQELAAVNEQTWIHLGASLLMHTTRHTADTSLLVDLSHC